MPEPELLAASEQQRYIRQLQLPGFGLAGQQRLKQSTVVIIGLGGLGCPAAQYLAAAGIGRLILVDHDSVSLSNLPRQILFTEADIGQNKATVAAKRLRGNNSDIDITAIDSALTVGNAESIIQGCDVVLDCSDNFASRYLINDICHHLNTPWIYASVLGFEGQLALIRPQSSCFRCLYPELADTPNCNQAGVLGVMPGIVASMQALMAIRFLAAIDLGGEQGEADIKNQLQLLQLCDSRPIQLGRSDDCPLCSGAKHYGDFNQDYQGFCAAELSPQLDSSFLISWQEFAELNPATRVLIDVRSNQEHQSFNKGGRNIPLAELMDTLILKPGVHYVFYCQSGVRSATAVERLINKSSGSLSIFSIRGGIEAVG